MKPEIILEIDGKGEGVSIEVKGQSGKVCLETTEFLEHALGQPLNRSFKTEYFVGKARGKGRLKVRNSYNE
jgi:hypothetical protein